MDENTNNIPDKNVTSITKEQLQQIIDEVLEVRDLCSFSVYDITREEVSDRMISASNQLIQIFDIVNHLKYKIP